MCLGGRLKRYLIGLLCPPSLLQPTHFRKSDRRSTCGALGACPRRYHKPRTKLTVADTDYYTAHTSCWRDREQIAERIMCPGGSPENILGPSMCRPPSFLLRRDQNQPGTQIMWCVLRGRLKSTPTSAMALRHLPPQIQNPRGAFHGVPPVPHDFIIQTMVGHVLCRSSDRLDGGM